MRKFKTIKRSYLSWEEIATARTITVERGLTVSEAFDACKLFNANRTRAQIKRGTRLGYTEDRD